jgi:hypothetical protein
MPDSKPSTAPAPRSNGTRPDPTTVPVPLSAFRALVLATTTALGGGAAGGALGVASQADVREARAEAAEAKAAARDVATLARELQLALARLETVHVATQETVRELKSELREIRALRDR